MDGCIQEDGPTARPEMRKHEGKIGKRNSRIRDMQTRNKVQKVYELGKQAGSSGRPIRRTVMESVVSLCCKRLELKQVCA